MLNLFISLALATPSDLPSGECVNDSQNVENATGKQLYETHCASCPTHSQNEYETYSPKLGQGPKEAFPIDRN